MASVAAEARSEPARPVSASVLMMTGSSLSEPAASGSCSAAMSSGSGGELSIISQPIVMQVNPTEGSTSAPIHLQIELPEATVPQSSGSSSSSSSSSNSNSNEGNHNQRVAGGNQQASGHQRMMLAAHQTTQGMRHRMSAASDQLGYSLRQLYASASSITEVPPSYHNIPGIVPYYHGRSSGPPPSYDDVINPYAPPPTYQSLFGQMREARKTSRGLLDLLRRLLIILISTLGCTILIAFMILIPFTMIIVGAVYIDECRVEHIPAFLLVGGLVWASKNVIHCYAQCQPQTDSFEQQQDSSISGMSSANGELSTSSSSSSATDNHQQQMEQPQLGGRRTTRRLKSSICESLLNCVLLGWFIAGCVIVFRNYEPDFEDSASARYCHRTVYMYTLWLITSAIVIFGLFIGCICCLMVSSAIASHQEDDLV